MDLVDPLQMVKVKMDLLTEVKREVKDVPVDELDCSPGVAEVDCNPDGEDELDCYAGEEEVELELDTDNLIIDGLLRMNTCQATGPEPGIDEWEGPAKLRFQFEDIGKWKKRGYTYSEKLNKLYIEMGKPVGVRFSLDPSSVVDLSGTVIRALPVYLETLHRGKPVSRCPVHSSPEDPSNAHTNPAIVKHLVRTDEPGTIYEENTKSGRLSTVVNTKEANPGCDYFTVSYQFMCLGSCMGGIGRRPICLVFTLETSSGEVLGRQVVELRICTCPLRDMQQDEQKKTKGDCTPVKSSATLSLPSLAQSDSVSSSVRPGGDTEDLYFVPVRGLHNFQLVNRVAESLELNQPDLLSETTERLKTERNKILRAKNPSLSLSVPAPPEPEHGPPAKVRKLEMTSPASAQQTRYLLPSFLSKAKRVQAGQQTSLLLPRSGTIVLPPRPPLGRGNSHLNNHQLQAKIKEEQKAKIKEEKEEEMDEEEDEEGIDQPDSLYCSESIEEVDGLMEFRRKIESDAS